MAYTKKIWEEAKRLYVLDGIKPKEIAERLNINRKILYNKIYSDDWDEYREQLKRTASHRMFIEDMETMLNTQKGHLRRYDLMLQVGEEYLSQENIYVRDAGQAAGLIDVGIKGIERIQNRTLSQEFLLMVLRIIMEEVNAPEILDRISSRFANLAGAAESPRGIGAVEARTLKSVI